MILHTSDRSVCNINGLSLDSSPNTQPIEHTRHVRRQLDTSAHEAEIVRILIYINILKPTLRQGKGSGQPTHTSANNGDLQILGRLCHCVRI